MIGTTTLKRWLVSPGISTTVVSSPWTMTRNSKIGTKLRLSLSTTTTTTTTAASSSCAAVPAVGFVGLGNMGLPMVKNLAASAGDYKSILAFDRNLHACEQAAASSSIQVVDSIENLSQQDVIVTMLPGDDALSSVLETFQTRWLQQTQQEMIQRDVPRIVVDCSTVSPTTSQRWSKTLQETGTAIFLDAPVSGGVKGATDGTLTFMLGGCSALQDDKRVADIVKSLLERMGSRIMECGPHAGAGAATKLCNNLALATQMIGICEALNLGEALGVDPAVLSSVLNSSTAACWSSKVNNPHPDVAQQQSSPACRNYQGGFATNLMLKDLGLAMQVGSEKHVALPLTCMSKELYQMASLQGRGTQDFGSMLQVLRGNTEKDS